jgi:hypothetical protein
MTDTTKTTSSTDWSTINSNSTTFTRLPSTPIGPQQQPQAQQLQERHVSRRPTDPLDEYFYEQAKFFRHLQRKYERFNIKSREEEQYARAGKFKHRQKSRQQQEQQQHQQTQQQQVENRQQQLNRATVSQTNQAPRSTENQTKKASVKSEQTTRRSLENVQRETK